MARQDDATKLLAIGLLNFADDEGYFYACPSLVRSALRPFDDDSSIVRRSIEQLSKIGFIEVREHETHGPVGFVVSFSDHQRVDRPKDSSIKELYHSTNDRRSIDDQSSLEGKGKEGKGKESVSENESLFSFPDLFSENRKQTFLRWAEHKAEMGQTYRKSGWDELLRKYGSWSDADLDEAVKHSMAMNYKSIFSPPESDRQQTAEKKPKLATAPANWQTAAEELYGQSFAGMAWEAITPTQRGQIAMHINQA